MSYTLPTICNRVEVMLWPTTSEYGISEAAAAHQVTAFSPRLPVSQGTEGEPSVITRFREPGPASSNNVGTNGKITST